MQFDIDIFREHLRTTNPGYSRLKSSSITPLESLLASAGSNIAPVKQAEAQELWSALPFAKQEKYAAAIRYLRLSLPSLVDATPVNPKMRFVDFKVAQGAVAGIKPYPMRFYHVCELSWQSSNGRLASLAKVGTRERVCHRTSPSAPPFDSLMTHGIPMVFVQGATDNSGADVGSNTDDHSIGNPSLILRRPLCAGVLVIDQIYEYSADGIHWLPIPGASYVIEKGVRRYGGNMVFYFSKRSASALGNKFHFEVEYPIGEKHPVSGNRIATPSSGFLNAAPIHKYASRVISLG